MFDISVFKSENPTLSIATVSQLFDDFCCNSQTNNKTTSMYLTRWCAAEVLKKHGVVGGTLLDVCSVEDGTVFAPTIVALLQAAASGKEKVFALIIVDVQNDFISGSLAVNEGADVVPVINELGPQFAHIYKTADWHPADHISFHSNVMSGLYPISDKCDVKNCDCQLFQTVVVSGPPELPQTLWPDHCIQNSEGAKFHPDMKEFPNEVKVIKGMNCCVDSYSGFWDNGDTDHTPLFTMLLEQGVTDVVICGIATDYCVGFTALDSARHGFRTVVVEEAIRGVMPATSAAMTSRCKAAGVEYVSSADIPRILQESDVTGTTDRIFRVKEHFTKVNCSK